MVARASISAVVLSLGVSVSAQQLVPADPQQEAIKFQVKNFESMLRNAVELGAQQVVQIAHSIAPGVPLIWTDDVGITGVWTPESGYHFNVVIPDILPSSAWTFISIQKQPATVRPVSGSNSSGASTVNGTNLVVNPDPTRPTVKAFDPDVEYSDRVRQALIVALVDNSGGLQFRDGERLQIVAGPGPQLMPNSLVPDSRKLILSVKGEDLIAFRKGLLKREELVAKIQERRF